MIPAAPELFRYSVEQVWLDGGSIDLALLAYPVRGDIVFVLAQETQDAAQLEQLAAASIEDFPVLLEQSDLLHFNSSQPLLLKPAEVKKPWGKEVWYSGIEQRGVSCFKLQGKEIPIPFILDAWRDYFLSGHQAPILFKTLVPLPDEVYGDLYLELHQQKQEVYVVTDVDQQAWPDGRGYIRLGFNPEKMAQYPSQQEFVEAWRSSIKTYQQVRIEIDKIQDGLRESSGIPANEPVMADQQKQWNQQLSQDLQQDESRLRSEMNSFTRLNPLKPGDVVKVPVLTPHALQHGVSVAEFQTPVYERKILSFAQKVLTQSHWDTDEAIEIMSFDETVDSIEPLHTDQHACLERVVSFDEFTVLRLQLEPGSRFQLPAKTYSLLFVVAGQGLLNGLVLDTSQAAYLCPQPQGEFSVYSSAQTPLILLLAQPCKA